MNYRYHLILGGPRPILEQLKGEIRAKPPVVDRPAKASLDLVLMGNTPEFETVQRYIKQYKLSDFTRKEAVFEDAEIASAPLLDLGGCSWLSDTCEEYDEPDFTDEGRCDRCGRGATALRTPLSLSPNKVPARANLLRIPPVLVIAATSFAMLVRKKQWSGVRLRQDSDFRSTLVRFFVWVASLSLFTSICVLLPFQLIDNNVQLVEARGPELAIPLDPCRLFLQSAQPELAGPHAPSLLGADEPRSL